MAALDAAQKAQIYRILYRLNLSFVRVVDSCRELQETGVFRTKFTQLHQAFAQELQAEINEEALDILQGIESDDLYRFGKARDARDKELRDPDDVFIHAEERKKELARQRKKSQGAKSEWARSRLSSRHDSQNGRLKSLPCSIKLFIQ